MKNQKLLSIAFALTVLFSACKDKKETDEGYEFAQESISEQKKNLENSGIEMINHMKEFKDIEAMETMQSVSFFFGEADPFGEDAFFNNILTKPILELSQLKNSDGNIAPVLKSMIYEDDEEELDLAKLFTEHSGTYTWDANIEDWKKSNASGKIEFLFPSTEEGTTNDASIILTYKGTNKYKSPIDDYNGELPLEASLILSVNGKEQVGYDITFTYHNDGMPASLSTSLRVNPFSLSASISNSTSQAKAEFSFKNSSTILLEIKGETTGDFNSNKLEDESEVEDVIYTANASFQVLNIMLIGKADVKKMMEAEKRLYPDNYRNDINFDKINADKKLAEEYNKHSTFSAIYVDSKKKIADAKFYQYDEEEPYWDETYTHSGIDLQLTFSDDSNADIESYFGSGFSKTIDEMNKFINDLNSQFDLEIDPMSYED